jgi:protein-S-isoprenylcysteine O-methyltransferase Ste14
MLWRAIVAFLACPGIVAFAVPALLVWSDRNSRPLHPEGVLLLLVGIVLLLWCVRNFYVAGKGTLAPWAPPRHLVIVGLYRYSRNPMYIAVALILFGWAWLMGSRGLLIYAVAICVAFHLRVVFGEEPWLARTHGEASREYRSRVPRWFLAGGRS